MTPTSVMIFAAGFGTRMRPLTETAPKPMIHVGGAPMIDHAISHARDAGARNIVANLHYLPDQLEQHLNNSGVGTIVETPEILDTGGGLRNALPLLGRGPVWTLNPDAIWSGPNPLKIAQDAWQPDKMDALLVCLNPKDVLGRDAPGDFVMDQDGRITRGPGIVYGGAQIIKTERLAEIKEQVFSLNKIWDRMMSEGRCCACLYPGQWCDVGIPEGIPLAETLLGAFHD